MKRRSFLSGAAIAGATVSANANAAIATDAGVRFYDEYDVVVVGAGMAGLCCAVKLGEAGKKVLLLEKMPFLGGNSAISGGMLALPGSGLQMIQNIDDSPEKFVKEALRIGKGLNRPELLETVANSALNVFEFLLDRGCDIPRDVLFGGEEGTTPRCFKILSDSGSDLLAPLFREVFKRRNVVFKSNAKFEDFILDENREIIGISYRERYRFNKSLKNDDVENTSGFLINVKTSGGVVLASGGFGADPWFVNAQVPRIPVSLATTNQIGATSGVLNKAMRLGASAVQLNCLEVIPLDSISEVFNPLTETEIKEFIRTGILVDKVSGRRFCDEEADPGELFRILAERLEKDPKAYPLLLSDVDVEDLVELALDSSCYKLYDNAKDISESLGVSLVGLEEQIQIFNNAIEEREDLDYGRDVSRHAGIGKKERILVMEMTPKIHRTFGGILINTKAQVIDASTRRPIRKLYAAGDITGGVHGAKAIDGAGLLSAACFGLIAANELI